MARIHIRDLEVNAIVKNDFKTGQVVGRVEVSVGISGTAEESKLQQISPLLAVVESGEVHVVRVVSTPRRKVIHRFVRFLEHHGFVEVPELPAKFS